MADKELSSKFETPEGRISMIRPKRTSRKVQIVKTMIRMYLLDKLTFNKSRLKKFISDNKSNNILVYVAPANFNSTLDNKLVPDKFHYLMELLRLQGMSPRYLLRYYVDSRESLKFRQILRQDSILQVRLRFTKLIILWFMYKRVKPHPEEIGLNQGKSKGILGDFLNISLEDTLRQTKPRLIFTIGVTQDFLALTNKLNIKVIEVMHGVFYDHEIKGEWADKSKRKPDLVLTWHDHYSNILRCNDINAITLGYPNPLFDNSGGRGDHPQRILVTLGYNEADSRDPFGIFDKKLLLQIDELTKGGSEIVFRMHPVVASDHKLYAKVIRWMKMEFVNPEVHSPFEMSIRASFFNVNFHLTKSSSSFFEASLLSIPTIFTAEIESLNLPNQFLESGIILQGGSLTDRDLSSFMRVNYTTKASVLDRNVFLSVLNQFIGNDR